jgi:5,10-methenyltetrahydromethanopterin hydrogenase
MLPYEVFEEYAKKRLKDILQKGEKPTIIAGFIDFFGDAAIVACSKCGVPVFVRPWVLEAITEHNLKVSCICCADPKDLKGQVAMDFAKIEGKVEQQICLEMWEELLKEEKEAK